MSNDGHGSAYTDALKASGMNRQGAVRWQRIAGIPKSRFAEYLAEVKESADKEITVAGALKLVTRAERFRAVHDLRRSPWWHAASIG